ncbi:hypothetical protein TREES_T100018469 [Tupaia chinensis]|uniref:Uncharacterized protein n=1 Tax=Tupaia chinensis TaxID=246437 RepID=L9KXI3_TUPCH|nr:hypothetical protein TREES_T100018469 [Tupaia chinensis]
MVERVFPGLQVSDFLSWHQPEKKRVKDVRVSVRGAHRLSSPLESQPCRTPQPHRGTKPGLGPAWRSCGMRGMTGPALASAHVARSAGVIVTQEKQTRPAVTSLQQSEPWDMCPCEGAGAKKGPGRSEPVAGAPGGGGAKRKALAPRSLWLGPKGG